MLLSNTIWCARDPIAAFGLLHGRGRDPNEPPVIALTPLTPSFCLMKLTQMRQAILDFGLVPDPDRPPPFVRTLAKALRATYMLESTKPGIVETCLTENGFTAPETLVAYGADFDPQALSLSVGTINLLVIHPGDEPSFRKTSLLRLWHRSTLIVPFDRLDAFADQMAAS